MQSSVKRTFLYSCQQIIVILLGFSTAYPQNALVEKEISEAINNVNDQQYEKAIPILRKYAEVKGFDDFYIFRVNVYLNFCYLVINKEALDVVKVNSLTDAYFKKYGISKSDSLKRAEEMMLFFYTGVIYSNVGNDKKTIFYLSFINNLYEENNLSWDVPYLLNLHLLAKAYYNIENYDDAIRIGLKSMRVNFNLVGENNANSLGILDLIYSSYVSKGELEKSLEYLLKRIEICKKLLGDKNLDYLESLNELAVCYTNLGDYQQALEANLRVVELRKEVLGDKHPDYLNSLSNLASTYSKLGDYKKALEIDLKVAELRKEVLGEKNPDYLASLNNLGLIYSELGNYKMALGFHQKVIETGKEVWGEKNPSYLKSLANLSLVHMYLGDYQKALEIGLIVVELEKEVLGEKDPNYFNSLGNLASTYSLLGDYKNALELDLKVVDLRKEVLGERHPDYIMSLGDLATAYRGLGDYQKALEINLKVVELRKEVIGEMHPSYLTSLGNLAQIYSDIGDYQKSLEINLQVVELEKEILGVKHPDYLTSLSRLARSYSNICDYDKSLAIDLKVSELRKEVLGEKHPDYITSLNNLALGYSDLGDYQKALEINLKVVELRKEVLGEKHPDYLMCLNNLAYGYSNLGDYQKSLEINLKVAELRKEILGEKHPDYIMSLGNLAADYLWLGDFKKALEINLRVAELSQEVQGERHPDYLVSLGNLVICEFYAGEINSALSYYLQMLNITQDRVIGYFSLMSERERELFWKKYSSSFMLFPMFFEKAALSHPEGDRDGYNISLFSKGLLLNTTLDFDMLIAEKGTPEAIAKFEDLKLLKLEIQRLLEKPSVERYLNVDSLENIARKKETELVKLSKAYGDYTSNMKINWQDVQSNLMDNDVAIEFVEYPTLTDTVKYAALVLRKGWQYPKFIPLFQKDQIEDFIKLKPDRIYTNEHVGKQIKKLIWSPLEAVVSSGDRVYFSPAGILHQIAVENLPADDSTTLGDRYQMYRLSSTKELILHPTASPNRVAVLYGGLQYELPEDKMITESKKYEKQENLYAMRGYSNDTSVRKGWEYLSGTLQEVNQIAQLMGAKQYNVTEFTGTTGNEESFKSLSGKGKSIIHIATHGFFLPMEESRKNPFMLMRMGDQRETNSGVDPMLRSGLMLSGGNRAWQGEKIPESIEDGVLTAKEISRMDLRGTDLVVLSACETGLGEVSSEGVFGLQRSFKQAGVKTLLMSLWEVNDQATRYIMTEFYSNLLSGKDKRTAFLEAKRKCKEKFPEPQYWAAFIMLD